MLTSMTWFDRVALAMFAAGAVWSAAHRVWFMAVILALGFSYAWWAIRSSRRGRVDDVGRLDAAQPLDERDRLLLARSLSIVGSFAVLTEVAVLAWRVGGGYADDWGSSVRLPLLCAVWLVANRVVVRRSATAE